MLKLQRNILGLMALAILVPTQLHASGVKDKCARFEAMGEMVMGTRQDGVPKSKVLGAIAQNPDEQTKRVMKFMVAMAYEEPRSSSTDEREQVVENFGNEMLYACMDRLQTGQ